MPQKLLGKAGQLLRDEGPIAFAARVMRRLARPLLEAGSVTFFVRDVLERPPNLPAASGFSVRQLHASDRDALLYGVESAKRWEALTARFEAGDLCFAALDEQGRAVHTRWVTLAKAYIPELGMDFVTGPDSAYSYDAYTRPDARRRGIDGAVRCAVFEAVKALGRRRLCSYARGDNPAGLRAAARHQQPAGTVRYVRILGSPPLVRGVSGTSVASSLQASSSTSSGR